MTEPIDQAKKESDAQVLVDLANSNSQLSKELRETKERLKQERSMYDDLMNSIQRHFQTLIARNVTMASLRKKLTDAHKELNSLREQLAKEREINKCFEGIEPGTLDKPINFEIIGLKERLAEREEVIRELIPIAEGHLATVSEWRLIKKEERGFWTRKVNEYQAIIEKAKILTK